MDPVTACVAAGPVLAWLCCLQTEVSYTLMLARNSSYSLDGQLVQLHGTPYLVVQGDLPQRGACLKHLHPSCTGMRASMN